MFHPCNLFPFCHQLSYKFSRVRKKFGVPVCFSDRNTADAKDGYLECASYQDSRFSIKRLQRDCGMQAVPTLQSSSAQTQWYASKSVQIKWICSKREKKHLQASVNTCPSGEVISLVSIHKENKILTVSVFFCNSCLHALYLGCADYFAIYYTLYQFLSLYCKSIVTPSR